MNKDNENVSKENITSNETNNNGGDAKKKTEKYNASKSFIDNKKNKKNKNKNRNNKNQNQNNNNNGSKNGNEKSNTYSSYSDKDITEKILSEDFTDLLPESDREILREEIEDFDSDYKEEVNRKKSKKKSNKNSNKNSKSNNKPNSEDSNKKEIEEENEETEGITEEETHKENDKEKEEANDYKSDDKSNSDIESSDLLSENNDSDFSKIGEDSTSKTQTLKLATIDEADIPQKDEEEIAEEINEDIKKIAKKTDRKKYGLVIVLILVLVALIFSTIFAFLNMNNDKILKNISVSNIYVGDLDKDNAKEKVNSAFDSIKEKEIVLKKDDYEYKISPKDISYLPIIDTAINEAHDIGRNGNIFVNNYEILLQNFKDKNIAIEEQYDREIFDDIVETVAISVPGLTKKPSHNKDGDKLYIYPGEDGISVKKEDLKKEILNKFKSREKNVVINIPVEPTKAETIDMDKIYEEVHMDPVDAKYNSSTGEVTVEEKGVDFAISMEEAKAKLREPKKEYIIPLKELEPKVTLKDLGHKVFSKVIGSDSTRYNGNQTGRTQNLKLVAKKINGYILKPGEVFSFNKVVGKRTIDAGYRNAPIYSGGKIVDDIGGGICQISSTIYGAVLRGGFEVVERNNHRFPTSYAKPGTDATVYYGALDFRFKNNKDYAVRIDVEVSGGVSKVAIKGIKDENIKINIATKIIKRIPRPVKIKETKDLKKGEEKVVQAGFDGLKVVTSAERIVNGKSQGWKVVSRDTYKVQERIVLRGIGEPKKTPKPTKKPAPKPTPKETEKPAEKPAS